MDCKCILLTILCFHYVCCKEVYKRDAIECVSYSKYYEYLCDYDTIYPNYIECDDDDDAKVHCRADKIWLQGIERVCDRIEEGSENCRIYFDAFHSIVYVSSLFILLCFCTCCLGCAAMIVYLSHCFLRVNPPFPSEIEKGFYGLKHKRLSHTV